ncbi:NACHT domain-containing protein [Nonomuraea sp. NPDC049714]|uniref:NACHT domain-containing protein n=1 Tax=Nonomuraea sp. NPDC049714 TaxID=3364357 RepID=UPI0037BA632A
MRKAVAVVALASLLAVPTVAWTFVDLGAKMHLGDLGALLFAGVPIGLLLISYLRGKTAQQPALDDDGLRIAAELLARQVGEQWLAEVRMWSLHNPDPIAISWELTKDKRLVQPGRRYAFGGDSAAIEKMAERFRRLDRRRLVIIGEPGTGKTTLAVQLLLLLARTRKDDEAVPVLLPLADWDPAEHPQLQDWLAARVARDYPALNAAHGPAAAAQLAAAGLILPVLDGMDELPKQARPAVLTALNAWLTDRDELILTSRTTEFAGARRTINAGTVITSTPLVPGVAAAYLERCVPPGGEWEAVLRALRTGSAPALACVVSTAQGLWMVKTVYAETGADPRPLLTTYARSPAKLRGHLLDHVVEALVATRRPGRSPGPFRPRRQWTADQVRARLEYLARLLSEHDTRELAWWRIAGYLAKPHPPPTVGVVMLLLGNFVVGSMGRSRVRLAAELTGPLPILIYVVNLLIGLVLTATIAIITVDLVRGGRWKGSPLVWAKLVAEEPGTVALGLRGRIRPLLRLLAFWGLTGGVVGTVGVPIVSASGQWDLSLFRTIVGAVAGLVVGLLLGFVRWASRPAPTAAALSPPSTWRGDRTLTLMHVVVYVLLPGLVICAAYWAQGGMAAGLSAGLVLGLGGGLGFWLGYGEHHAWLAYKIIALRHRRLPYRLMGFLDDAHRMGLLRAVGPHYQFRHAELHDHLARSSTGRRDSRGV